MITAENIVNKTSLVDLLDGLVVLPERVSAELNVDITSVQLDSRLISHGDLFFACFGSNHDARDYIGTVIDQGAVAVLAESGNGWHGLKLDSGVPIIAVDNLAVKIGKIAARFYQNPSSKMHVIGITGTNGKTSCTQFIAQALNNMQHLSGVIGTLGTGLYDSQEESLYTTPDAVFNQSAFAKMLAANAKAVIMEVSSQGLHQHRVVGVDFDTAIFTNLTRDHLDYHEDMNSYGNTKKKLFVTESLKTAIVNIDDPYAIKILNVLAPAVRCLTFSISNRQADIYAKERNLHAGGYDALVSTPWGEGKLSGSLLGSFNFSNILAVLAALLNYDDLLGKRKAGWKIVFEQVCRLAPVRGRMEIVGSSEDIAAVVDYAHTPDALRSALEALREHYSGEIWCVFGCGGNRDRGKRPIMAEVAEKYADHLVITDDNPRNESADDIVKQILLGLNDPEAIKVDRDRAAAISFAINHAKTGDVVLVAGKGHETYQELGGNRMSFSDVKQVRLALQERDGKNSLIK